MKTIWALGLAAFALSGAASAQTAIGGSDPEALGLWYKANVERPAGWIAIGYAPDVLAFAKPMPPGGRLDAVAAELRFELTQTADLEGVKWRSALVRSQVDCQPVLRPAQALSSNDLPAERARRAGAAAEPPTPPKSQITVYAGQNLTGAARTIALDGGLPGGVIGDAMSGICRRAMADKMDQGAASPETPMVGRDKASRQAWLAQFDISGWQDANFRETEVWLRRETSRRGSTVRADLRGEFYEPLLTSTQRGREAMSQVTTKDGKTVMVAPAVRPAWIRSTIQSVEFDCKAKTMRTFNAVAYEQHAMQVELEHTKLAGQSPVLLNEKHFAWPLLQTSCAASAGAKGN